MGPVGQPLGTRNVRYLDYILPLLLPFLIPFVELFKFVGGIDYKTFKVRPVKG